MKTMGTRLELELDDGENRVLKLLAQAHRQKESVQYIRIEYWGDESGLTLTETQYDAVFDQIGALPNVKEIILHFTHEAPLLPAQALQKLIYNHATAEQSESSTTTTTTATQRLEYLSLHRVKLSGSRQDFQSLGKCLRRNRSLKKAHLSSCQSLSASTSTHTIEGTNTNDADAIETDIEEHCFGMNFILQALSNLPCLQSMHLDNIQNLSAKTLTSICSSRNLQKLELWSMAKDINIHGSTMLEALESNHTSLREIEISSSLREEAGNAILSMLQVNTTLDTLGLDLAYTEYGDTIAESLARGHSTIKTLRLRIVGEHHEEPDVYRRAKENSAVLANAKTIVQALRGNNTLEHLHMNFYQVSPEEVSLALVDMFEELLEVNFVLAHLSLRGKHTIVNLGPDLHFALKLNGAGRYRLLQGDEENAEDGTIVSRSEWFETILEYQQDLSVVFYFLSAKPTLCYFDNIIT